MKIKETIGIDVSKLTIDVTVHSNKAYCKFENTVKDFKKMVNWVFIQSPFDPKNVLFVFEHTGLYSHKLAVYLTKENISFSMVPGLEINRSLGIVRGKDDRVDSRSGMSIFNIRIKYSRQNLLGSVELCFHRFASL